MPTRNAEKSILNSVLNFAGGKSLANECSDCQFYVTLFDHLIENTLTICGAGKDPIATFSILAIASISPSL
jgi:hypothetical protein